MKAMMEEFGIKVSLVVKSDAVAAIGIVKRQGLGRVRHLAVADLWVQQRSKRGEVSYVKLEGRRNPSDILTKAVDGETLARHVEALGMTFREGRNEVTPEYNPKERIGPEEEEATGGWSEEGQEPQVKPDPEPRSTKAQPLSKTNR